MTTQPKQVLLVDDEEKLLRSIAQRMKILGFAPHTATNGMAALEIAKKRPIDLAIVDLQMPDMDGLVVITKLKEIDPQLRTVLLTGHGNEKVKQATESLNSLYFQKEEMGDFWHFIKQLNADGQVVVIHPASTPPSGKSIPVSISASNRTVGSRRKGEHTSMNEPAIGSQKAARHPDNMDRLRIVGETVAMQELRKAIARAASLDCIITLKGEPGSGKELVARAIHNSSRRAHKRFLAIDCANFSNAKLSEQLLGFTGGKLYEAIRTRSGIFGSDPVGTLLIDNVDTMPIHMQDQLLNALTMTERRDDNRPSDYGLNIRLIAASETDLANKVKADQFKQELYDRLSVFELTIPPLRERRDDIPPLCRYFFDKYRKELSKSVDSIAPEVVEMLVDYNFPGNVRELEHIIERAVIIADGKTVMRQHLPARFLEEKKPTRLLKGDLFTTLAEVEKRHIFEILDATHGNKSKTAEILGISRAALWRKLKKFKGEAFGR
ncbi:MAG: sigma-54 dependent transcriptional regulator [Desulfobacterales bacterium]|jgi:two-component system response regulator AtoC